MSSQRDQLTRALFSNAILRHVARKANHMPGLLGKDLKEQAVVDMLLDTIMDFRNSSLAIALNSRPACTDSPH
jgi:hypothetical protein